jgi:hypothetical protein
MSVGLSCLPEGWSRLVEGDQVTLFPPPEWDNWDFGRLARDIEQEGDCEESQYPPGVLTGRPLETIGGCAHEESDGRFVNRNGPSDTLGYWDITCVPEQWVEDGWTDMLVEMFNAIQDIHKPWRHTPTRVMDTLSNIHDGKWVDIDLLEEYPGPREWDDIITRVMELDDLCLEPEIAGALDQFEQDWDYEQTLIEESSKNMAVNLHRLLAIDHHHGCSQGRCERPGWCGEKVGQLRNVYDPPGVTHLLMKERYKWMVKIVHLHPPNKKGYAVGATDYGKIYFPEKFRNYIHQVGDEIEVTVALQDVGDGTKKNKGNSFRFTAIFLHTGSR